MNIISAPDTISQGGSIARHHTIGVHKAMLEIELNKHGILMCTPSTSSSDILTSWNIQNAPVTK